MFTRTDNPTYFKNVNEKLSSFECDFMVFVGDFNLVCDVSKDKKGGVTTTHDKSRDEVEIIKQKFELTDIWRVLHPDAVRFTWRRKKPEIQCRLDTLFQEVTEAEIVPGYRNGVDQHLIEHLT